MRLLRCFTLIVALVLWAGGLSGTVSHWLYKTGIIVDDYRFGDLYRLSALPQFKQAQPVCPVTKQSGDTASTHLYIIGDSFSEPQRISKSDFPVSHYQRVAWDFQQRAQLDTTRRNVLILESVERHFREHFARPVSELVVEADTAQNPAPRPTLWQQIKKDIHWGQVEERLESTLFGRNWAFWFKELKATLTLNWFNRWSTSVSLSDNGQNLYLSSDTDTTKILNSSFSPLTEQEVNTLVDSVNAVAARYRQLGFDEVYLSIIPNKASILETNRSDYNHLIERVQGHSNLRVTPINVYTIYRQSPSPPYLKSDTHWNCTGRALWLDQVRQLLNRTPDA